MEWHRPALLLVLAGCGRLQFDDEHVGDAGLDDAAFDAAEGCPGASGLVGYWKFDEGSGTTVSDASGNGNAITLVNAPTWETGVTGSALHFDGTTQYGTGMVPYIMTNASVSVWARRAGLGSGSNNFPRVVSWWDRLEIGTANMRPGLTTGDLEICTANTCWEDPGVAFPDTWTHIVVTVEGTNTNLFVNGSLLRTSPGDGLAPFLGSPFDLSGTFYVGASLSTENLDGAVDELRVYDRVLDPTEVAQLANPHCAL